MKVLSRDVKAIVYRHAGDGKLYVHAFGAGGDQIEVTATGRELTITNMPARPTNVHAIARFDGTVQLEHGDGESLWGTFDV